MREPVSVIVPIHNGREHLRRLFATLFAHTEPRHPIVLANDGSTDLEIAPLLARATGDPNVKVLTSTVNRGFVATVNQAMQATSAMWRS